MSKGFFRRNYHRIILTGIIAALFINKLPALFLPHFWDDAWPYATGVHIMYEHGLSLMPGAVPFDVSRGHPLLFHFLFAGWMKLVGTSLFGMHFFSFLISVALLMAVYFFCRRFFNREVAAWACVLLVVQPVFAAQTGLVLPEMLLALFGVLSLFFYLQRKNILYIIFATCMMLTKESGAVLVAALLLYELTNSFTFINKKVSKREKIVQLAVILLPMIFFSLFFISQKIKTGYFFLPLYTSEENFHLSTILTKLHDYSAYFFVYQGKNIVSATILVSLLWMWVKKISISDEQRKIVLLFSELIILFLIFSSCNFYSPRYLLFILPLYIMLTSFLLTQTFSILKIAKVILWGTILVVSLTYCFRKYPVNDHTPSYVDAVIVNREAVNYLEEKNLFESKIGTDFLMSNYLTNRFCGYLSRNKTFTKVVSIKSGDAEFYVYCSFDNQNDFADYEKRLKLNLLKRFEKNYSWTEIYSVQ